MKRQLFTISTAVSLSFISSVESVEIDCENRKGMQQEAPNKKNLSVSEHDAKYNVEERVKRIVAEQLGVTESGVLPSVSFVDDLGADSLDTVELIMALEEEFKIEIPDEAAEKITTVQDAIEYIMLNLYPCWRDGSVNILNEVIRNAEYGDLDSIAALTYRSWHGAHKRIFEPELTRRATVKFFRNRWKSLLFTSDTMTSSFVFVRNGHVRAVGACGPFRYNDCSLGDMPKGLLDDDRLGELFRGYLDTNMVMRNTAVQMFSACTERLKENGFERVGLWIQSENTLMRQFVEEMGCRHVASRPARVFDELQAGLTEVLYLMQIA